MFNPARCRPLPNRRNASSAHFGLLRRYRHDVGGDVKWRNRSRRLRPATPFFVSITMPASTRPDGRYQTNRVRFDVPIKCRAFRLVEQRWRRWPRCRSPSAPHAILGRIPESHRRSGCRGPAGPRIRGPVRQAPRPAVGSVGRDAVVRWPGDRSAELRTASVRVSPVSFATSRASRSVSGSLRLSAMRAAPDLEFDDPIYTTELAIA